MSGIYKRTLFYAKGSDGLFRQSDWALVVTGIGSAVEPVSYAPKLAINDSDGVEAGDMMSRIDEIRNYEPHAQIFGDDNTIGGGLIPVLGY